MQQYCCGTSPGALLSCCTAAGAPATHSMMDFMMLRVNTASDIWRLMAQTAIQVCGRGTCSILSLFLSGAHSHTMSHCTACTMLPHMLQTSTSSYMSAAPHLDHGADASCSVVCSRAWPTCTAASCSSRAAPPRWSSRTRRTAALPATCTGVLPGRHVSESAHRAVARRAQATWFAGSCVQRGGNDRNSTFFGKSPRHDADQGRVSGPFCWLLTRDARRTFDNGVVVGFIQRDGSNQAHLAHLNPPVRPCAACFLVNSQASARQRACPCHIVHALDNTSRGTTLTADVLAVWAGGLCPAERGSLGRPG